MAQRDFEYPRTTTREPDPDRTYVADSQNRAIVYIVIALVVLGIAFFATRAFWGGPAESPPASVTIQQPATPPPPSNMAPTAPAPLPANPPAETPATPSAPSAEPAPAAPAQPAPAQ